MIFSGSKKGDGGLVSSTYATSLSIKKLSPGVSPLQMYNDPPQDVIQFDEFVSVALERFSILQLFETMSSKYLKYSSEYYAKLETELRKIGFLKSLLCNSTDSVDTNDILKDNMSHFILRLAYCKNDELKKWFINQEVDLFRYKLYRLANEKELIETFINENNLHYSPISDNEKQSIIGDLNDFGFTAAQIQSQNFYKVDWTEVFDLVKQRRVILKAGYAYVTINDFNSILSNYFRAHLSLNLTKLTRVIKIIEEDQRINDLLVILRERNVSESYATIESRDHLTAESVEQLSTKSFPICMRNLNDSLKTSHHLKHHGRLQYSLFLKGIGLPMEENLRLLRTEFSRGSIAPEKFDKEYAYNIRHSYGKEGKRTSYTPYSCLKIITGHLPSTGDHHGCPFKHFDREFLRQKLRQYGRTDEEIKQMIEHVDSQGYQIACQRYFEYTHKTEEIIPINHPNQYFEHSYRLLHGKDTKHQEKKSSH